MAVARPAYQKLEKEGKDMNEKEIGALVDERIAKAADKLTPKVYERTEDVPEYWRREIAALVKAGALKGDGTGAVNLTETEAKVLAVVARLYKGGECA